MKLVGKIIEYLLYALIAAIAVLVLASALPVPGGIKAFVVQSGSMEPAIKTGSVVIVKPAGEYKTGDVITFGPFSKTKPPTTHCIAGSKDGGYVTKGDANNAADARTVSRRDIVGKVYLSVPFAGYAVAAAKKPLGFAIIILVPAAIVIFDELRKIWTEAKKLREKKKAAGLPDGAMPAKSENQTTDPQ